MRVNKPYKKAELSYKSLVSHLESFKVRSHLFEGFPGELLVEKVDKEFIAKWNKFYKPLKLVKGKIDYEKLNERIV